MTPRALVVLYAAGAIALPSARAGANEVIRSQVWGPFISCRQWTAAHKGEGPERAQLEALVRGYAEGVGAHRQQTAPEAPLRPRLTPEAYFAKISDYCSTYEDNLIAAAEIVLEREWPGAGDRLTGPGVDGPAPKSSYTFVPSPPPKAP